LSQESGYVFLIEEFAGGGDLLNFLFAYGGKVPEAVFVKRIAKPLFMAVQYMHAEGIVHRYVASLSSWNPVLSVCTCACNMGGLLLYST
jgi:hypothetical protein